MKIKCRPEDFRVEELPIVEPGDRGRFVLYRLSKRSLGTLEERRFGPRVGVDRILRLLDRLKLRATFFIPGWTVENHLAPAKRIRDAGHEIGAHGNVHEAVDGMTREQEEAIMRAQLAILQDHLGVRPASVTA